MVEANYMPLVWARQIRQADSKEGKAYEEGYILGFMNSDLADRVTHQYVSNVMNARARGVSA